MSWIIQNLLSNRTRIKDKSPRNSGIALTFNLTYGQESPYDDELVGYDDPFIESDEFNDLLVVEKAIEELVDLGLLSQHDLEVLERADGGKYNRRNRQRKTHAKKFAAVCNRIAYYLGGYFTDEGYIDYLSKRHRLDECHKEVLRNYMKSKFKYKILSKGFKPEKNHEHFKNFPATL